MDADAYLQFAAAEHTHWWFMGRKSIFSHFVSRLVREIAGRNGHVPRMLDLGCGMGAMLEVLERHGEAYGLDVAPQALRHCHGRGLTRVFQGHGQHLPFAGDTLDLVVAFDTIEHIPQEIETLRECHRALRPGGFLFVSVPAYQWLYTHQDRMVHHQRRYTAGDLRRKLRALGFEVEKASYINFLLFPLILPVVLAIKLKEALFKPDETRYFSNASIRIPRWMNALLYRVFAFERHLIRAVSAPAGHSLIVIARKTGNHAAP